MRPLHEEEPIGPGDTLFHSAFGFARVESVDGPLLALSWEQGGDHLPRAIPRDTAVRHYSRCAPGGFFDRCMREPDALRDALHTHPTDVLVALLDDLGEAQQRSRDVMDWLIGRGLLTAKTFVRWWGSSEALIREDGRLEFDGEWIRRRGGDEPLRITQLEPDLVAPEVETDDVDAAPFDEDPTPPPSRLTALVDPVPLVEARPPARSLPQIGHAVARALAQAHADGVTAQPEALRTLLLPDGNVQLGEPPAPAPLDPARAADDVRAAAIVLLEACTGRSLPPGVDPADLMPHLRHRIPDAPPSSLAPLFSALARSPDQRPSAEAWLAQWEAVRAAEDGRDTDHVPDRLVAAGYDSHIGRTKLLHTQVNQDSLYVGTRGPNRMLVLADGISVSDAGRGDLASKLTTSAVGRLWENIPDDRIRPRRLLDRALHLANRTVCERALRIANGDLRNRMPMGSTVVVALLHGNRAHITWLGDSRVYLIGPYGISLLTCDDNVSGERFQMWCDGLSRSWSPHGHALVRYVGHFDEGQVPAPFPAHRVELNLRPGERLVLCSDGITDYIDATEPGVARRMWESCREGDPDEACRRLVNLANRLGGGDNATAIVVVG